MWLKIKKAQKLRFHNTNKIDNYNRGGGKGKKRKNPKESIVVNSEVAQSCPTFCDPMDCSLPGSFIHGLFQARELEWVAISFSRGSSWPKDLTCISCIGRQILYHWATREALLLTFSILNSRPCVDWDPHLFCALTHYYLWALFMAYDPHEWTGEW